MIVSSLTYQQLALDWKPDNKNNRLFNFIVTAVVLVMLIRGIVLSSITVPETKRQARNVVPERIANFIIEKKKPEPKIVKPKPKPKPILKPKPEVKKKPKKKADKPLTKKQKTARKKAAKSGLLALSNELADLMDTSDISSMVAGNVKKGSASVAVSNQNKSLLTAGVSKGSSGVDAGEYTTTLAKTKLSQREITQVKQSLLASGASSSSSASRSNKNRSSGVRAEEGITVVFDQNKSKLYSIYNRARRTTPNLKGKIILQITIAPGGKVTKIKMLSSELNNPKLESRLISRIKMFNFGSQKVESIVVTYPIEFLPS